MVLTNGGFDAPLHPGHIAVLAFAARLGYVLVAVDSDENVRKLKGKGRPIFPLADRVKILAGIRYVSGILPFDGPMREIVEELRPDVYVKGAEWKDQMNGAASVGRVACCPMQNKEAWSTSVILAKIRGKT